MEKINYKKEKKYREEGIKIFKEQKRNIPKGMIEFARELVLTALELHYPQETITKICNCKSTYEMTNIMTNSRLKEECDL